MTSVKATGTGVGSGSNVARDNTPTETIRKLEDTYTAREIDESKKHREELATVNETHKEELQKIQDTHERALRDIKARSDDTVTKQDMNYQKEIKDLKDMYNRKIEKMAIQNKKATENGTES